MNEINEQDEEIRKAIAQLLRLDAKFQIKILFFLQLVFATQPITNVLLEKRKKMVKELKRCSLHHVAAVPECNAVFIFIQFVPSLTYTLLHSTTIIIISILQLVILNCSYVTSTTMTTEVVITQ